MPQRSRVAQNAPVVMCAANSLKTRIDGCHLSSRTMLPRMKYSQLIPARQVQDLERQLQETRAQLERLRASEHFSDLQTSYGPASVEQDIPDVSRSPRHMLKAGTPRDLSAARAQLSDVGRGILKPPLAPSSAGHKDHPSRFLSSLPSREVAQHCLENYFECVHRRISVLHWPLFYQDFWKLYSADTATSMTRETIALRFSVLALGALFSLDPRTKDSSSDFISASFSSLDFLVDPVGIDQGLASFHISIYLAETNKKSTSYVWLGSTIRVAQDRGLHIQGGHWPIVDGELRKRIWYSLYVFDR